MQKDPETFAIIGAAMATGLRRGLLLNLGSASLEYKRLVLGSSDNLRKSAKSVDEIYL